MFFVLEKPPVGGSWLNRASGDALELGVTDDQTLARVVVQLHDEEDDASDQAEGSEPRQSEPDVLPDGMVHTDSVRHSRHIALRAIESFAQLQKSQSLLVHRQLLELLGVVTSIDEVLIPDPDILTGSLVEDVGLPLGQPLILEVDQRVVERLLGCLGRARTRCDLEVGIHVAAERHRLVGARNRPEHEQGQAQKAQPVPTNAHQTILYFRLTDICATCRLGILPTTEPHARRCWKNAYKNRRMPIF